MDILVKAYDYYKSKGFEEIPLSNIIDIDINNFTCPESRVKLLHSSNKVYCGSAEQSFLQYIKDHGELSGNFMCFTSCYRDEPECDDVHLKMFEKLELFSTEKDFIQMSKIAGEFFKSLGVNISYVKEGDFLDIYGESEKYGQIEIGSYGSRIYKGQRYTYATGVAFPRVEYVIY